MKSLFILAIFFVYTFFSVQSYCIYNKTPKTECFYETYKRYGEYKKLGKTEKTFPNSIPPNDKRCCVWTNGNCYKQPASRHWWHTERAKEKHIDVNVYVACSRWEDNKNWQMIRFQAGGYLQIYKSPNPGEDNYIVVHNQYGTITAKHTCGQRYY